MAVVFDHVSFYDEIKNISTKIENRKITGIIGSRCSGKSSFVDLISGDFLPSSGYIYTDDKIGVVYQNIEDQFFYETIKDEFIFSLKINGEKDVLKRMNNAIKMVGFNKNVLDKSIYDLSLSEQKRISLAIVLALNPRVIVLDDLFFGLDVKTRDKLIGLIRLLKVRYEKSIVITSTDSDLIHSICDNVILLNGGSMVKSGDKYSVFTDIKLLNECSLFAPRIIQFSNLVLNKKKINLGYRDDINDLVKDIYRFVR